MSWAPQYSWTPYSRNDTSKKLPTIYEGMDTSRYRRAIGQWRTNKVQTRKARTLRIHNRFKTQSRQLTNEIFRDRLAQQNEGQQQSIFVTPSPIIPRKPKPKKPKTGLPYAKKGTSSKLPRHQRSGGTNSQRNLGFDLLNPPPPPAPPKNNYIDRDPIVPQKPSARRPRSISPPPGVRAFSAYPTYSPMTGNVLDWFSGKYNEISSIMDANGGPANASFRQKTGKGKAIKRTVTDADRHRFATKVQKMYRGYAVRNYDYKL